MKSVSISWLARNLYRECKRKWLNYYVLGDARQGEERAALRAQSKLTVWRAVKGHVVDDAVKLAVRRYRNGEGWPEDLVGVVPGIAARYRAHSVAFRTAVEARSPWPVAKSVQPVDRVFFGDDPTDAEWAEVVREAQACVARFDASGLAESIRTGKRTHAKAPDQNVRVDVGEFTLAARPDLLVMVDGRRAVVDLKAGQLSEATEAKAWEQLAWYGVALGRNWGLDPAETLVSPMFLAVSAEVHWRPVGSEAVARVESEIVDVGSDIARRLEAAGRDVEALKQAFPLTEDTRVCAGCVFRACEGWGRGREVVGGLPLTPTHSPSPE